MTRHAGLLLFALFLGTISASCGGCGGNKEAGVATVMIDDVDPVAGYADVPITVRFTIEPGERTNEGGMSWRVEFGDGTETTGDGVSGEATHAFALPGQYDVEVNAVFDDETVGTAVAAVRVYSEVDLVIDQTRGAPANARVGEDLQVSFVVTNNTASEVFTPFEVAAYVSEDQVVTEEDLEDLVQLGMAEITPDAEDEPLITSGGERSAAFSVTVPNELPSGDYYVVTQLDPRGRIADTDRSSNIDVSSAIIRVENPEDALPDLCLRQLYVSPDRAFPQLNSITRAVSACNDGGQDAFDVVVKTYLSVGDPDLDASDLLIDTSEPFDVFANSSIDVGPDALVLPVGQEIVPTNGDVEVWVIVVAETQDDAADADPENNSVTSAFSILVTDEPVEGPDIVVNDFTVSPNSTFLNGSLNVTADIENAGTVDVGSFFCAIYLGAGPRVDTDLDPRLVNINIPSLDSGATTQVDQAITVPGLFDPGVYYLYMVCDPLNALQEPFRSNNAFIFPEQITITDEADVDLYVESLTVPTMATEGDTVEVVARFCVQGSNPSGPTIAQLFMNVGTVVDYNRPPVLELDVPNVLPGGSNCLDLPIEVEATCADFQPTYAFGIATDVDNRLPELNETNNRQAGTNPLTIDGPFCSCDEDMFEPNDSPQAATSVQPGPLDAAICTAGGCDYWGVDVVAGESLIWATDFDSEKGDLQTTLFAPPDWTTQLQDDTSADHQEVATFLVPTAGTYVVRVCGATSIERNEYAADIQVLGTTPGIDVLPRDFALPFGDTFTIGETLDTSVRVYNLGATPSGAFDVEVYISADASTADDGNNTLVASAQVANVSGQGIVDLDIAATLPTTLPDGEYYLFVALDPQGAIADADTSNNRILSGAFEVVTECYDPLEPNDSFGQAVDVSAGSFSNLQACASQDDFYRLCLPTGKRFDVTVDFVNADGDIDVELLNDQSVTIDSSANTGVDVEQVSWDFVNGDQCYTIRVYVVTLDPDLQTSYSMQIDVEDVDPQLLCSSVFEPNDGFATASSLTSAINQTATLDRCPASDEDFYFLSLAAGQQVTLTATKDPAMQAGTLRLQTYLPNQTPDLNKETGPGVPSASIDLIAPTTGVYFLKVSVSGATRNVTYRLSATGLNGLDLSPTNLVLGPGTYQPSDEVRFAFDLANLRTNAASTPPYEVFFGQSATPSGSDVSLGVFSAPNVPGNSVVPVDDKVFVPANASAGTRYIHVVVDGSGVTGDLDPNNNTVTVPITIVP